ncbi:unnamed protein product [Chironomus riparius]|uniref:27 kDa salivary protein n=1 Tax=Chironomus riparius TaxID=315576 RepID=A0A9N9RJH7_9DIPT|nr:unnamed protein product [Chironomus riparius]
MVKIFNILIIILLLVYNSNSCSDKINDIHILLTNIQDAGSLMETSLRAQYNTFLGEKLKSIGTLLGSLKTLQNELPTDLCKYQSIDVGSNIIHAMNNFIDIVRKNVLYSVKSSLEDAKIDHSNILYDFIMYVYDFIDKVGVGSKNLFNDGKGCVMDLEGEIKSFIDLSSKKFMECLKNVSLSSPIQPVKFKAYQDNLTLTVKTISYKLKEPFWYIWVYSTTVQTDLAAEKFNSYCQSLFPTILDIGKQISQIGLDIVNAVDANNNAFKTCFNRVNATLIDVKKHELQNKVNDICSKA